MTRMPNRGEGNSWKGITEAIGAKVISPAIIYLYFMVLTVTIVCILSGCSGKVSSVKEAPASAGASSLQSEIMEPMTGSEFLRTDFKITSTITARLSNGIFDGVAFEVYVNQMGNGEGLAKRADKYYQLDILSNELYIWLSGTEPVRITDITGHMTDGATNLIGENDLTSAGFTMENGIPYEYSAVVGDVAITSKYELMEHPVKNEPIAGAIEMTFMELMEYLVNGKTPENVQLSSEDNGQGTSNTLEAEAASSSKPLETKRVNSKSGIVINGVRYSIGDSCNPSDYFEGLTPTGLVPKEVIDGSEKRELLYITYAASAGSFEVMTIDGVVQSIYTTIPFSWIGLDETNSIEDIRLRLGGNLTKTEQESWIPYDKSLKCNSYSSTQSTCTWGNISITLKCKDKKMSSIRLEKMLDFLR